MRSEKLFAIELSDVAVDGGVRPVISEDDAFCFAFIPLTYGKDLLSFMHVKDESQYSGAGFLQKVPR